MNAAERPGGHPSPLAPPPGGAAACRDSLRAHAGGSQFHPCICKTASYSTFYMSQFCGGGSAVCGWCWCNCSVTHVPPAPAARRRAAIPCVHTPDAANSTRAYARRRRTPPFILQHAAPRRVQSCGRRDAVPGHAWWLLPVRLSGGAELAPGVRASPHARHGTTKNRVQTAATV